MNPRAIAVLVLTLCMATSVDAAEESFAIRDGDTVVFLGDSITAARQYGKVIEQFTLLRFPERKVRFINAGRGGDTMKGSLARLEADVFERGATLVTVAFGVNDIGWGAKADAEHKQQYLDAVAELVDRCQKRGVRVFICSAAITAEAPDKAENGFLQQMCDEGMAIAKSKGAGAIDVQRSMRQVQRRVLESNAKQPGIAKPERMHTDDGIHLNDLGQMAMAFAILKGLGAPADVSSATIDATNGSVTTATGCKVMDVRRDENGLSFTRLDERLPLNLAPLWMLAGQHIPISGELNRYLFKITGLPRGRYEITAGGRPLGEWDAGVLGMGVNLATATADPWVPGGPWDAQAHALKIFTDIRDDIDFARRGMNSHLTAHPTLDTLRVRTQSIERAIVELQREMAKPIPVTFVVRRASVGSSRVDLQACKLEYSIVSPK